MKTYRDKKIKSHLTDDQLFNYLINQDMSDLKGSYSPEDLARTKDTPAGWEQKKRQFLAVPKGCGYTYSDVHVLVLQLQNIKCKETLEQGEQLLELISEDMCLSVDELRERFLDLKSSKVQNKPLESPINKADGSASPCIKKEEDSSSDLQCSASSQIPKQEDSPYFNQVASKYDFTTLFSKARAYDEARAKALRWQEQRLAQQARELAYPGGEEEEEVEEEYDDGEEELEEEEEEEEEEDDEENDDDELEDDNDDDEEELELGLGRTRWVASKWREGRGLRAN